MDISWVSPFVSSFILGVSIASVWLVAALGLAVIYGVAGVINMAHGEFIMLGAYSVYLLEHYLHIPYLLCLPLAFILVGLIGLLIERGLIRYLYNRPLDTLLATWGLSIALIQIVRLGIGSDPVYINTPNFLSGTLDLGLVHMSILRIFILAVTALLLAGLWYLFYRTNFGIKVRAVTQNREMAASFGIDAKRIYMFTFALGAGLAGVAGTLFAALTTVLPTMGAHYVVQSFLVVVTGGGALFGSVASSAMMGEVVSFFSTIFNPTFARFLVFMLIVCILWVRPQGLFSRGAVRR